MGAGDDLLVVGDEAPDFCLPDKDEKQVCLKDQRGKWIVLYFYPKDNTPGCTIEAISFTKSLGEFNDLGAVVLGLSPDDAKSHCRFYDKHDLNLTLLSDQGHGVLKRYGSWKKGSLSSKLGFGAKRHTFLIDSEGVIAHIWRKVNVHDHIDEVKDKLRELRG